jgi:predicted dehydrogenase
MRIAIIGCGLIGAKRAAAAQNHQIVVVCDLDIGRANALAEKTGARAVQDWREAIKADVDVVIVATTHDQLAGISIAAVEAGKHVLVEKPAGRNVDEVRAIAAAAKSHKRVVKVGFNHRFHPALQKAREIFDQGVLGPMMFIRGRYGHGGRLGMENEWRCKPELSGGGQTIDQGSHLIDLSRWFIGDLAVEYASAPTLFWKIPVEDNCFMALRGTKGEMAWLHVGWTEWKNLFSFEISGRDGKLQIDGLGGSYGLECLTYYRMLPQMGPPEKSTWEYPGPDTSWALEFEDFIAAIGQSRRPSGDLDDAIANYKIIKTIYENYR